MFKFLLAIPFMFLAACAGQSISQDAQTVATDVSLIATGLQGSLAGLQASGVVSTSALAKVQADLAELQTVANTVKSATSTSAQQSGVQQVETLVNGIVTAVAGLNLPAPFGPALSAAEVLLPVIEVTAGLVAANIPQAGEMTPDQARLILAAAAR